MPDPLLRRMTNDTPVNNKRKRPHLSQPPPPSPPGPSPASPSSSPSDPLPDLTPSQWSAVSSVYSAVISSASTLHSSLTPFLSSLSSAPPSSSGHSLYDVKVQSMLQYLIRLLHVIRCKVAGDPIDTEVSVDEMTEIRVVLERIRPLERAIAYSVDRLLSTAAASTAPTKGSTPRKNVDPLTYRPNPLDLLPTSAEPSSSAASAASTRPPSQSLSSPPTSPSAAPSSPPPSALYRPPHHNPTVMESTRRSGKMSARSSRLMQTLSAELSNGPEEIRHEGVGYGEMNERAPSDDERVEYEERMMVRLIDTKQDKRKRKERERRKALEDVDDYDDLRRFVDNTARNTRTATEPVDEGRDGKRQRGRRGGDEDAADDLFDGIDKSAGPRKRGKFSAKGGRGVKASGKKKGKGGGRRRF